MTKPEFVNVEGAQDSISRNRFRQPIFSMAGWYTANSIVVPTRQVGNWFLGFCNISKFGLRKKKSYKACTGCSKLQDLSKKQLYLPIKDASTNNKINFPRNRDDQRSFKKSKSRVRQPYSYSVPSPHSLFKNSSTLLPSRDVKQYKRPMLLPSPPPFGSEKYILY
jgi:hypothetical protein